MKNSGKTVISVAVLSVFARAMTLLSQQVYISHFGGTKGMNIFSYALNMPNTVFNCIGTALSLVIIPIYTSLLAQKDGEAADNFLNNVITISSCFILTLIVISLVAAPLMGKITGYGSNPEDLRYLVFALRVMMPIMFFYGLNYIFQGISQAHGMFYRPAIVTLPASIITMGYTLFLSDDFGVTGLLVASFIGLCLQPFVVYPAVKKTGYKYKISFNLMDRHIIEAAKKTLPVLASASAYQINTVFNVTMATRYDTVMLMVFAQQIVVISVLTVIYSITGVYFPRLTSLWAVGDIEEYRKTLSYIISLIIILLVPAGAGFFILRYDIMNLLINYKKISQTDVVLAADMLGIYGGGILFVALKEVLDRAFYSRQDTKTPAVFGFVIMAANIVITFMLTPAFGPYAMPVAYGLSACIGAMGLFFRQNRIVCFMDKELALLSIKSFASTAIMIAVIKVLSEASGFLSGGALFRAVKLGGTILPAMAVYFFCAYVLGVREVKDLADSIVKKLKRERV